MQENNSEISPQAEHFLEMIKSSRRGKFKIYIGMAAGVGKTYRMLMEANVLLKANFDLRIGIVETHDREETAKLLEGIPLIQKKQIFYKGKLLEEMDIDAILNLKPEIVLVDELAHTNIYGSRNKKRWEDVVELINAGINVISTVNIQHIESINKEVEKITGVEIQERVPDSIIHLANEVVNVDLTIEELIERIKQGKVYKLNKTEFALSNFFQPNKLLQLRELALKEVTRQVGRKLDEQKSNTDTRRVNSIITCISTNHNSATGLIRRSSRLVSLYNSKWYVLYVQSSKESLEKVNSAEQRFLLNNFRLATELNAEVVKLKSDNIHEAILQFAFEKKAGIIVMGKPEFPLIKSLFKKKLVNEILSGTKNKDIDILLVSSNE